MTHANPNYIRIIHERGFRVTPQRQIIFDAICESGGHTTIDEIYQRVCTRAPTINLATVYRTVDFFCKLKLVVAADVGCGHTVYEVAGETPHHHLVCRNCGVVLSLNHETARAFFDEIGREYNFTVDMGHLALFGLCQMCQEAAQGDRKDV